MNIFLQFKNQNYVQAYTHDFQLQLKKRGVMITFTAIVYVIANGISIGLNPNLGPTSSKVLLFLRLATGLLTLAGIHCLIKYASKCKKHIAKINIILDSLIALTPFVVYPLAGNLAIDAFSKLGVYIWAWSAAFGALAMNITFGNWWMKAVVTITQYVYFFIFLFQREKYGVPIFIFGVEVIILYLVLTYIQERYERLNFLEKRKIYDNYEAIKKIVDDISQGIMIVDQSNEVIYANRIVYTILTQDPQTVSLSTLFSQVFVKSISPPISAEIMATERVISMQDSETDAQSSLNDCLELIKRTLFDPNATQSAVTVESYWQDPTVSSHKIHLSIKFTTSLFMDKQVFVVNITDVTDRDSLIAAQASSEYKSRLLSSVSHELRTPLNGSINFIEQVLSEPVVPKAVQEKWLIPALRCNRLLLSLVNDILDFSQIHAGKLRMCFEPKNVVETAKECIELLEIQAAKKCLKLELINNLSKQEEVLNSDHNRLRQVILNLLSNAVKFTFEGSVSLILDPAPIQNLQVKRKGIKIACRDTGIGISPKNQEKLFKVFEKIELGEKSYANSMGAGLGLVISNNIVQRLSPKELTGQEWDIIRFESQEKVGTTFYFEVYDRTESSVELQQLDSDLSVCSENKTDLINIHELEREFPLKTREMLTTMTFNHDKIELKSTGTINFLTTEPQIKTACDCPKVLIVDDDVFNLTALSQILAKNGVECHWAFHGKEAIEKVKYRQANRCSPQCQQYKAIFLDLSMPILNGFETAKLLRKMIQNEEIDDLRIIACTAFLQESDERASMEAGMNDFCTKPVNISVIKEKLQALNLVRKISVGN